MDILCGSMKKHIPVIGNTVQPDEWKSFGKLTEGSSYSDSSFPGCEFYLESGTYDDTIIAVNVKVTGKPHLISCDANECKRYKSRVKVEFVGDGLPSTFSGGWIFHG